MSLILAMSLLSVGEQVAQSYVPAPLLPVVAEVQQGQIAGSIVGSTIPLGQLPVLDTLVLQAGAEGIEETETALAQLTAVEQLTDVQPTDWSYGALQSLIEKYGLIAGYPDGQFRGNRPLSRYEFAAGLNRVLEEVGRRLPQGVPKSDLVVLQRLQANFRSELEQLQTQVGSLESRTQQLEQQRFSTTTRLFGQVIVGIQGSNQVNADLFPQDGIPERSGQALVNLTNTVQLSLVTSFTGQDLLLTTLQAGNSISSAPILFTNLGRLGSETSTANGLLLSDLSYRFRLAPRFGVVVGPVGVNPVNTFRGINPLEGAGEGALSLLGQRNPILNLGSGTGGIGFDWQISQRLSLQGVYSAAVPGFPGNSRLGGLVGGRTVAGVQLTMTPINELDIGLNYLYSYSPDGVLGTGIGDAQLLSPLAPLIASEQELAFNTHAIGATLSLRIAPEWTFGAWAGWTTSIPTTLSGTVETNNWMIFSAFPDLGGAGNLAGLLFGQPPKIASSTLPDGFNFPNFLKDLSGTPGGRPGSAYHLEAFYRFRLSDNIALTPGVIAIFNPDHNSASSPLVLGVLRATLKF